MTSTHNPFNTLLLGACASGLLLSACGGADGDAYIKSAGWTDEVDTSIHGSLVIDNQVLVYSAYGLINQGTLTEDGLDRGSVVAENLLGQELGTTYCDPTCGGIEASISVVRDGNLDAVTYPLGAPPPVLSLADDFVNDIMRSLEQCLDTTEFLPDDDCLRMATD